MRSTLAYYAAQMRVAFADSMQYRAAIALQLLGKFGEPIVYLVVWSTVARQSGGEVAGFTADTFAGYFIVWTLVRQMTVAWSPYWMETRIRRGEYSPLLLRPVHPFHFDTANLMAGKGVELFTLVPTMAVLVLVFRPSVELQAWCVLAFVPALLMGFFLRHVWMYSMSLTAFWTTRVTALFQMFFTVEFFLSGRIAPISLLPEWGQQLARSLPFVWMFGFPLELLLGRFSPAEALAGFAHQVGWLAFGGIVFVVVWRAAIRRYSAVGG
jgi:ABC-2 type transport system permease protein